ncbi:unnamed protein product [Closterium sp. Yama58-4]|nr:unnamed protein product [Closterium sp. Yama58-4]
MVSAVRRVHAGWCEDACGKGVHVGRVCMRCEGACGKGVHVGRVCMWCGVRVHVAAPTGTGWIAAVDVAQWYVDTSLFAPSTPLNLFPSLSTPFPPFPPPVPFSVRHAAAVDVAQWYVDTSLFAPSTPLNLCPSLSTPFPPLPPPVPFPVRRATAVDVAQWYVFSSEVPLPTTFHRFPPLPRSCCGPAVDVAQWYVDTRADVEERIHKFNQPASDRLLPDLAPQEQHVYTLVLDLEGTLVHSDWKRDRGWRTFKRPGAEAFLERMAQFFEVVVFSDQLNLSVDPILDRLDQKGCIRYRLYRDGTLYTDGNYVRDLSKLNRDPNKVIYISSLPQSVLQKENLVPLPAWKDTGADTALLDLLPFLECVARQRPADIRVVLQSYEGQDIPTAFKERSKLMQKQLQERKQHGIFRFARGGS